MSLSDCIRCWSTPCNCGWDYKDYSKSRRLQLASVILGIHLGLLKKEIEEITPENHPFYYIKDYRLIKDT